MSQINNIGINGTNPSKSCSITKLSPNLNSSKISPITTPKPTASKINNGQIPSNSTNVEKNFTDSMTKAILRYLGKNHDSSKTDAEKSVFIAIGYKQKEEDEYKSFEEEINHFRRHHIMRSRDAIRSLRIKQIMIDVNKQYPTYSTSDVLIHLTTKLNELYLPSPSPPPPIQTNNNDKNINIESKESVTEKTKCIEVKTKKDNENVTIPSIKTKNNITCSQQFQYRHKHILTKGKIKNYTINYRNNNGRNDRNDRNINNKQKITEKKQIFNRDVSPSQIHITLNDNNMSSTNSSSSSSLNAMSLKPKINEIDNYSINKQGIGFKQGIGVNFIDKNLIYTNLVDPYPNRTKTSHLYPKSYQSYTSYDDDEVAQKIKLHKKAPRKKRKLEYFDNQQPPKKRTRIERRGRSKNKTIRGRGRGNKTRSKYINHSSECFDDEEDEGSDIDINSINSINSNINNLSTTNNSHL